MHVDAVTDGKQTEYIHGVGQTLAHIVNDTDITYLHNDHLGTAFMATDGEGNELWEEEYTPFGEKYKSNAANDDLGGYTGHIYDSATGLNYMQARYHDPVIGRFLSIDPVGFKRSNPMSFNRYAYANNNPYTYVDPDGREASEADYWSQSFGYENAADLEANIAGDVKDGLMATAESSKGVPGMVSSLSGYLPGGAATVISVTSGIIDMALTGKAANAASALTDTAVGAAPSKGGRVGAVVQLLAGKLAGLAVGSEVAELQEGEEDEEEEEEEEEDDPDPGGDG